MSRERFSEYMLSSVTIIALAALFTGIVSAATPQIIENPKFPAFSHEKLTSQLQPGGEGISS